MGCACTHGIYILYTLGLRGVSPALTRVPVSCAKADVIAETTDMHRRSWVRMIVIRCAANARIPIAHLLRQGTSSGIP